MRLAAGLAALVVGAASAAGAAPAAQSDLDLFEKKVRPVLVAQCYSCHSTGEKARGGLLLDSRQAIRRGGDSGPALVPGAPEKSLIIQAIKYQDDDLQMPPKHRMSDEDVAALEEWVRRGAPDPREQAVAAAPASRYVVDFEAARKF